MRALGSTSLLLMIAASIAGCGDNRRITNVDGGRPPPPPVDGGSCPPGTICLMDSGPPDPPPFDAGGCVPSPESDSFACGDFRDNDCDLQIDCNDVGCCPFIDCEPGTLCGNMARDAGTARRDAGPTVCGVATELFLPSSCLPRCSATTETQVAACEGDPDCIDPWLDADPTPSAWIMGQTEPIEIDCAGCYYSQLYGCWEDSCPSQFVAWYQCLAPMPPSPATTCRTQIDNLTSCINANATAVGNCESARISQCFP